MVLRDDLKQLADKTVIVQDTGTNTNPEQWLHDNHWETAAEVTITVAGAPGVQNLGAAVPAARKRRIKEISVRHLGTNNTIISLLVGAAVKLTFDVPAQTTRVWSSQDGRAFAATEQPLVQSSNVVGGNTFVTAAGVEK